VVPLDASTVSARVTITFLAITAAVAIAGQVIAYLTNRASRTSAERLAQQNRDHAAEEARQARLFNERRSVYVEALDVVQKLRGAAEEVVDERAAPKWAERVEALQARSLEVAPALQVFGSWQAFSWWKRVQSQFLATIRSITNMRVAMGPGHPVHGRYDNLKAFAEEFTARVREDLGVEDRTSWTFNTSPAPATAPPGQPARPRADFRPWWSTVRGWFSIR
jgi:hypothetical protein